MSELDWLQQRQQLLEQAARLQRATINVRLQQLQDNRWTLFAGSVWQTARRWLPAGGPLMLTWRAIRWLWRRRRPV